MNIRQPTPRLRADGKWFVRWGGPPKDHYLSTDAATAKALFFSPTSTHPGSLEAWRAWSTKRRASTAGGRAAASARSLSNSSTLTLTARDMFRDYLSRDRAHAVTYFRAGMARFLRLHGEASIVELASTDAKRGRYAPPIIAFINAFISDLSTPPNIAPKNRLAPKTINHEAACVKRLFNWAAEQGRCPAIVWRGVKRLPTRRGIPQVRPINDLAALLLTAGKADPDLVPWLAVTYLCLLRPSETPRLVAGAGEWLTIRDLKGKPLPALSADGSKGGVFRLAQHKGSWRGENYERFIVVTPEAARWLSIARPVWSRLDSWSAAARAAGFAGGPSILRDSAASHLRSVGVDLADVQTLLGHLPPGEWKSYAHIPWPDLLKKAARIALDSTLAKSGSGHWSERVRSLGLASGGSLAPRHRLQGLHEEQEEKEQPAPPKKKPRPKPSSGA